MSDTPKTDKAEKLALELTKELTWDCVVAGEAGIRQIARECRKFERENAALRSIAAAMAEEMEQHGGELAFDSLARYRAEMGKEAKP